MSFNQSRSDNKTSDTQYRKFGRSATSLHHQRPSQASYAKGGGGGGGASSSPASSSSLSSSRSFKKSSNAQGGQQPRVNLPPPANSSSDSGNPSAPPPRHVQNGAAHVQQAPLHVAKSSESPATQRSTRGVPKAPTSQSAAVSSEAVAPTTPKPPVDSSKPFPFQFGSITPGFMNGMQVPARTSSAPPNLDEQKRDQARHEAFKSVPSLPTPVPKQQLPRKDVSAVEQSNISEVQPVPKTKKDAAVSLTPPVSQTQKPSVLSMPISSMPMSYHQPQVAMPFGSPSPQIQSQGVTTPSLQMQVPLQMGNAPQVQPPVFVQGIQHHPMQPPGIMGQSLGFTTQLGPQLSHQLSNLGIGVTSQYPQQQGGKFGGNQRKAVKITDPKTHEELRLDKRTDTFIDGGTSGLRSHPTMPPQSQPIGSYASSHPMNYYSNSFNASNLFYTAASSLPLTSNQMAPNSHPPRFSYPVSQGLQSASFMNPAAAISQPVSKPGGVAHVVTEPPNLEHVRDQNNSVPSGPSGTVLVTVKPATSSVGEKVVDPVLSNNAHTQLGTAHVAVKPAADTTSEKEVGVSNKSLMLSGEGSTSESQKDSGSAPLQTKADGETLASSSLPVATKVDAVATTSLSSTSSQSEEAVPALTNVEGRRREPLSRSDSIKDNQKKSSRKGQIQVQHQIGGQATSVPNVTSHTLEHSVSSSSGDAEVVESKTTNLLGEAGDVLREPSSELESKKDVLSSDISEAEVENDGAIIAGVSLEIPDSRVIGDTAVDVAHPVKLDSCAPQEQIKGTTSGVKEQAENAVPDGPKQEEHAATTPLASTTSKQNVVEVGLTTASGNEVPILRTTMEGQDEPVTCQVENDRLSDNIGVSTDVGKSDGDNASTVDTSSSRHIVGDKEFSDAKSTSTDQQFANIPTSDLAEATSKHDGESVENTGGSAVSLTISGTKELIRSKSKRKNRKELLQKADAQGMTSDLYMAYKGPEEKKENVVSSVLSESISTSSNVKQAPADAPQVDSVGNKKEASNKIEPDDWEDAADVSTPKLETSANGEKGHGESMPLDKDGNTNTTKKYSRDFLLKFSEQFTDLPEDFDIIPDIAEALSINVSHLIDRESYPSPGRVIDRSPSGSRMDRRVSGIVDDRWNKLPGSFVPGRDFNVDMGFAPPTGFRSGPGGVLRNPRAQAPVQYAGGILSGPMQSMGFQGGMQRNNTDAERWQRATNFQKGLIPSPQTPLQMMHKAERKYEVGKVSGEGEAKQRQFKAILNKLTPQNFEKLFEQMKAVNIDSAGTLTGVISQIFDKALMEPTFCEMYANFCFHLAGELPDFIEDNEKVTFKRLLLNKCQEEFERGEREQEEANKADEEGEIKQTPEQREEKRVKARRRMLGNIRLIGELYKKKMLTDKIMHECIRKLLGEYENPDEEDVEALCKLMSTIGEMIDHPKAKIHMDLYFDRMSRLSDNMKLSSRVRFMLKDAIDLRKNKWQQRRKVEGPKKIEEVHRDAAQERSGRMTRNPSINSSARRVAIDFGLRGSSMLSPPNAQMGGFRGLPTQVRGFGTQDVRFDERQAFEARTLPLPQRPLGNDTIMLGPQGGLARGMSFRGPSNIGSTPAADVSPSSGDSRRMATGLNGFTGSERPTYGSREDVVPRFVQDRFAGPTAYDQMSAQERNMNYISRDPRSVDRGFDRSAATSPPTRTPGPVYSEERLREMSMAAIKEFYSARDEKEVALCIKDLNSPSFHPSMISLWVTDSFERKDMERDLLAKLLVSLARSWDGILTQAHLTSGFEHVLTTLEDAVNDAPKAPEFLSRIFAKVIMERVVPLSEIGRLLREGGEEPGRLHEVGLAGDVLGSTLEVIKAEKGEGVMNDIRIGSSLNLESFRPPDPNRSMILEKFI